MSEHEESPQSEPDRDEEANEEQSPEEFAREVEEDPSTAGSDSDVEELRGG